MVTEGIYQAANEVDTFGALFTPPALSDLCKAGEAFGALRRIASIHQVAVPQLDGLGVGTWVTSKAIVISPCSHPEIDIDYLVCGVAYAEPSVELTIIDCGHMLAAVAPFAIEKGWVRAELYETQVRICAKLSVPLSRWDGDFFSV